MTINRDLILAGIGTPSLQWWAPRGTALPTDASTALATEYLDLGLVAVEGAEYSVAITTEAIDAFGIGAPARVVTTSEITTFKVSGLETNLVSAALYNRLPLTGAGSPTVTAATGAMAVTSGPSRSITYVSVTDMVDGANKIRKVCPNVELTGKDPEAIAKGKNVAYGMEFTACPDANGVAVYTYYILNALKTA